jgi:hypothetical protein
MQKDREIQMTTSVPRGKRAEKWEPHKKFILIFGLTLQTNQGAITPEIF